MNYKSCRESALIKKTIMVEADNNKTVLERKITLMNGVGIIVGSIIGKQRRKSLEIMIIYASFQVPESSYHQPAFSNIPSKNELC